MSNIEKNAAERLLKKHGRKDGQPSIVLQPNWIDPAVLSAPAGFIGTPRGCPYSVAVSADGKVRVCAIGLPPSSEEVQIAELKQELKKAVALASANSSPAQPAGTERI